MEPVSLTSNHNPNNFNLNQTSHLSCHYMSLDLLMGEEGGESH